ncbi:MAG: IclR family transcriptional regulator [Alcaligenaceae bacterium]
MRKRSTAILPSERTQVAHEVDSLNRGLELVRSFRPGESSLNITELASRTGLKRATAQRLVDTLVAHDFLEHHSDTDRYGPAVACLVLGHAYLSSAHIGHAAQPIMQALASKYQISVALGSRDRLSMICLELCHDHPKKDFPVSVGSSVPITATALGRAWLWGESGTVQGEIIQRTKTEDGELGARTIPGVYRAFQEMEEQGYCVSFGEWIQDISAIGTVITLQHQPSLALSCEMARQSTHQQAMRKEDIGAALIEAASRIKHAITRQSAS